MSASVIRKDTVLSFREREKFKQEIAARERELEGHIVIRGIGGAGSEGMDPRRQGRWESFMDRNIHEDPGPMKKQLNRLKRVLDKGSPRDLSKKEKRELEKLAKQDAEFIGKTMVPGSIYFAKAKDNPNFQRAVDSVYKRETGNPEFQKRAQRFMNIMRELHPDDDVNIERFRPK